MTTKQNQKNELSDTTLQWFHPAPNPDVIGDEHMKCCEVSCLHENR